MSLDDYRRKRSFKKTPEPPGRLAQQSGNSFFIQRHSASRLHYDLRLEMDGVLRSWAVPKGPTLDPAEKRLAVLVEDHPLEYGDFEGTIPEGNYGAGRVLLWDRGTYEWLSERSPQEMWERGDLKFRLHGHKLMGEFALVRTKRGKGNEWLLIKKKDFAAQSGWNAEDDVRSVAGGGTDPAQVAGAMKAETPRDLIPMLACPSDLLPEGAEWIYEVKWDGVRALVFVETGAGRARDSRRGAGATAGVRLVSRSGKLMNQQYPELLELAAALSAESAILDGEIVAFDEQGRPSFARLQPRMMASARAVPQLLRERPVALYAFDLPYLNGYDLREAPLIERKRLLQSILRPGEHVRISDHFTGNGRQLLEAARANGLEGVVAKRALSRYESRRSQHWLKVKVVTQQEFVIGGMTAGERQPFGSLALGCYQGKDLIYCGNAGSGFDQRALASVHKLLKPLVTAKSPFQNAAEVPKGTTWVKPGVVCTVRFNSWTEDGRLRAPVFVGIRPDMLAQEVVREAGTISAQEARAPARGDRMPLLSGKQAEVFLDVDGRRLKFTNLNKVFYPREGYSKRDVPNYYDAVAPLLLPHLKDRPLSLKRYPDGIEGEHFFQKNVPASFPEWMRVEPVESGGKVTRFALAEGRASLLYLANLGCIDQNPWMSRMGSLENPDFILLDLDPVDCAYDRMVEAACLLRLRLEQLGLAGWPKTTGGDGLHIYVPLEPHYSYEQARTFAEVLARLVAAERPDLFTLPRKVEKREKGKVYFDYLQIGTEKTISAPYVLRAYPGAPVATPLEWREVRPGLSPAQFTLANVLDRFQRLGDLFAPVLTHLQPLEPALAKLEDLVHQKKS